MGNDPTYPLARVFPVLARFGPLPFTRDQAMLLLVALSEALTGLDTFLVHGENGTIVPREWIPVIFGPTAAALLVVAGLLARRARAVASTIATVALLGSVVVGVLGSYYHLEFGLWPTAPVGQRVSVDLLVWAPPILGPMMFAVIGLLGISAAWKESPKDSGRLELPFGRSLQLPYSKTRAYVFAVTMASLATLVSAGLDHARLHYSNLWLLVPVAVGLFATGAALALAAMDRPTTSDYRWYAVAMVALIAVGPLGSLLHIAGSLGAAGEVVEERILRGAPLMAPLLFSNVGLLGLIALLDPAEHEPG